MCESCFGSSAGIPPPAWRGTSAVLRSWAELLTHLPHTSGYVLPGLSHVGINKQLKLCPKPRGYLYKIIECHLCLAVSFALATCQWEKATNINIYKCFFRHESSSWGVRLLCRLPLQGSQEAMTLTVSQAQSSILTKYQSHFSPDFSSAWAYLHFLPNPVAYQKSLFSRPVYLQQTSNILFSTSKSHLTSFLKIWH